MGSAAAACASPTVAACYLNPDELTRCLQAVLAWQEKQEQYLLHGGQLTMESVTPPPEYALPSITDHDQSTAPITPDDAIDSYYYLPRVSRSVSHHASATSLVVRQSAEGMPATLSTGRGRAAYIPMHAAKQFLLTTGGRSVVRYSYGSTAYGSRSGSNADLNSAYGGGRSDAATATTTATTTATAGRARRAKGARARDDASGALRPWRSMGAMRRDYRAEEDVPAVPSLPAYRNKVGTTVPAAATIQEHVTVDWTQSDEQRTQHKVLQQPAQRDGIPNHATTTSPTKEGLRPLGLLRRIKSRLAGGSRAGATAVPPGPAGEKAKPSFLSFIGLRPED